MIPNKQILRQHIKEKITSLSTEDKLRESQIISDKLIKYLQTHHFDTLITYDPLPDEVDISAVNEWIAKQGLKMEIIKNKKSLELSAFSFQSGSMIIMPGRAFTLDGKRLGRGGGFYDKLLAKYPDIPTIGICFACQVLDEIPQDSWDKEVDKVVSGK